MAKIVIIGNGPAGFSCCSHLISNSCGNEITVISLEKSPAYKSNVLVDYLAGNIQEKELFLCAADYYEKNKINLLKETKAVSVNTKKQLVTLKEGERIAYDYLVIATGQKVSLPDIPGKTKEGVLTFYNLQDANSIKQRLLIASTVCVLGEANRCQQLAEVFIKKDKEVRIISKPKPESFIHTEKTEWIDNFEAAELIGEGAELRALKLSNGKVIGTSLVVFTGNYLPATDFLKETDIGMDDGYISVGESMNTNFDNIFACGSACRNSGVALTDKTWDDAAAEGVAAACGIVKSLEGRKALCQQTS